MSDTWDISEPERDEYDWDHDCVACDFTAESPEELDRHYELMCGPNGDDLHRVWV